MRASRKVFCEVLGRELHVPDEPRRVISFSPAVTETLFLLGQGDALSGVSAFCARPPEARQKRVVGSYNTIRPEVLRELRPDLIFATTGYQRAFAERLSADYPVYAIELPVTVASILDMIVKVGLVMGTGDRARRAVRDLLTELAKLQPLSQALRVYVEIDLGGPVTFGAYSYLTDALSLLGCLNIYGGSEVEWLTPDLRWVAGQAPDVILYEPKMFSRFDPARLPGMWQGRGWHDLPAVTAGQVFVTPGPLDFLAHHGPAFLRDVLPWLQAQLQRCRPLAEGGEG